jgi:hypothetical protein
MLPTRASLRRDAFHPKATAEALRSRAGGWNVVHQHDRLPLARFLYYRPRYRALPEDYLRLFSAPNKTTGRNASE